MSRIKFIIFLVDVTLGNIFILVDVTKKYDIIFEWLKICEYNAAVP